MVITNRDREFLLKLHSYGMLATNQVKKIVFNDIAVTTVLRRLRILERKHLIKRVEGFTTTETLWALTEKGAETANVQLCKRHFAKVLLEHDYKLLSLRLCLEDNGIAHSWTPEHEIRSKVYKKYGLRDAKNKLIPDGLMGIEVDGKKVSVAIELELTLKNQTKLIETLRRYKSVKETFAVWYIVPTRTILNQIHRLWYSSVPSSSTIKIYYSYYDEVIKNPLKARLISKENPKIIGDYWKTLPAQETAQGLSTHDEKNIAINNELTKENHAPILEMAS
jgi:DNA-binding HxlR family transcriptional regulator